MTTTASPQFDQRRPDQSPCDQEILAEVCGKVGMITLNRPRALNALSHDMVQRLYAVLLQWKADPKVLAVAIRGQAKTGPFGVFCAGGDIRQLHAAAIAGGQGIDQYFADEYRLDHLVHHLGKPYIAFMDGVVMGGGMGISQGASLRLVTEHTRMAMPETAIGFFPDVGGGYFLSRCPGHVGEWLGLSAETIHAADALAFGLADGFISSTRQQQLWDELGSENFPDAAAVQTLAQSYAENCPGPVKAPPEIINRCFSQPTVTTIEQALKNESDPWAAACLQTLHKRSPLMMHVVLEQIRRARAMTLAEDLRMEMGMVHQCFSMPAADSETVEGIRALAVDKDFQPRWRPTHLAQVSAEQWQHYFQNPWSPATHPLRDLG